MVDMIRHDILPAVSAFSSTLCQRAADKEKTGVPCKYEAITAREIGEITDDLLAACNGLEGDLAMLPANVEEAMTYCHDVILADMAKARSAADQLEALTAADYWPFPVYSDLLFSV